jgi:hypothetical protein
VAASISVFASIRAPGIDRRLQNFQSTSIGAGERGVGQGKNPIMVLPYPVVCMDKFSHRYHRFPIEVVIVLSPCAEEDAQA